MDSQRKSMTSLEGNQTQVSRNSKIWPQFVAGCISSLGALNLGICFGWSSPAISDLVASNEFNNMTKEQESWMASLVTLGCLLSTIPGGYAVEQLGRKRTILVSCIPLFLGWLQIAFADSVRMIYCGRLITGFFTGIFSQAVPIYLGEIAENRYRGQLGSFFALQGVTGTLVGYIFGSFCTWRLMSLIFSSFPLVLFVGLLFIPESPTFLLSHGHKIEAAEALKWLRGVENTQQIETDLNALKCGNSSPETKLELGDWFSGETLKPLSISIVLMIMNQWSGIGIAILYTVQIFESAGSTLSPMISTIIVGAAQVFGVALSTIIVDRLGRRVLLIVSSLSVVICFIPMGGFYYLKEIMNESDIPQWVGMVPLVCLVAYIILFSIGLGPIPWMITGELMAPNAKGLAITITTTFNWLAGFILAKIFVNLTSILGVYCCYWLFAGIGLFGAIFTFIFLPETKNKSYEEIALHFTSKKQQFTSTP